ILSYGRALAAEKDLPRFVQSLVSLETALVRVDLLAGQAADPLPQKARLRALSDETRSESAELLGRAPSVDPQTQGASLFFLTRTNEQHLAAGTAVTAFLELPQRQVEGVVVPRDAIVRFEGLTWVYMEADGGFARRRVELKQPLETGWLVTS